MAFFNPGDCDIHAIALAGSRGVVNLTNLLEMVVVYEDLTLPGINIEIVVLEDKDLLASLPLVGEEVLYVDFATPSLRSFTHTFAISSMEDANASSNLKTRSYRIVGVAKEVFAHKTTQVTKSYRTNNSEIVRDIITSFLKSDKQLFIERTKGIQEYIVTNKRPYTAIKDVLDRSVSEKHESSSYVFFENQKGIHFRTVEELFEQPSVASFTNNEVTADSIYRVIFRNILGYNLPDQFNTAEKIGQGAFASTIQKFDMKSLLFSVKDIKPDVQSMARGMQQLMSSSQFKSAMSSSGISRFVPKDSSRPETHIDEMIPKRTAYAAELDQGRINVRIFGDSTLTVGDKVTLNITTNTGAGDRSAHQLIAGDYLITKMKSIILPADVKPRYTQMFEAVSAGYASSVG